MDWEKVCIKLVSLAELSEEMATREDVLTRDGGPIWTEEGKRQSLARAERYRTAQAIFAGLAAALNEGRKK